MQHDVFAPHHPVSDALRFDPAGSLDRSRRSHAPFRLMTYSHDSFGLGHLRRSVSIASALVRRGDCVSALCVTGSPTPEVFTLPERCDLIKLPAISKDSAGAYIARNLPISIDAISRIRSELLTAAVRSFRPHVLLVDHTPTGPCDELLPVLRRLRHEAAGTRTVLGLRDIIDEPGRVRASFESNDQIRAIREYYDQVLVYGERSLLDVRDYGFDDELVERVHYVGVVCPPHDGVIHASERREPHVVVTAGGGEDGYGLLRGVIAALRGPMRDRALRATIVAGPLLARDSFLQLERALSLDPRLTLLASTRQMGKLLDSADVVVGMGGYNSVYEALSRRLPLLALPRVKPRKEQLERCTRLAARGLLRVLDDAGIADPQSIAIQLDALLDAPPPSSGPCELRFDGVERVADHLQSQPKCIQRDSIQSRRRHG